MRLRDRTGVSFAVLAAAALLLECRETVPIAARLRRALKNPKAVTKLDLSHSNLTSVPPEVFRLTSLKELDLSGNRISTIPPLIGQLSALQTLDVSFNELSAVPAEFTLLRDLRELRLGSNQIATLPHEISRWERLDVLDVSSNALTSLPSEIGDLENLRILMLSRNHIHELPAAIGRLARLKELDVSANDLATLPPDIAGLANLERLDVGWAYGHRDVILANRLERLPVEIRRLQKVRELNLARNKLHSLPAEVGEMQRLEILNVANNRLAALPQTTCKLSQLTQLNASANSLVTLPLCLSQLPRLTRIDVSDNRLGNLPVFSEAVTVIASGNPLSRAGRFPRWIVFLLRILTAAVGVIIVYASVAMYEDEEKRLQNRLEELWVVVDDYRRAALSTETALVRASAAAVRKRVRMVFGDRLRSTRAVFAAAAYVITSSAAAVITIGFAAVWCEDAECSTPLIAVMLGVLILVGAVVPLLLNRRVAIIVATVVLALQLLSSIGSAFTYLLLLADPEASPFFARTILAIGLAPWIANAGATLSNLLILQLVVMVLRRLAETDSLWKSLFYLLALTLGGALVVTVPFVAVFMRIPNLGILEFALMYLGYANLLAVTIALAAVILILLMLVHRLFWPAVSRLVYAVGRVGILQYRKTLFLIGVALVSVQFPTIGRGVTFVMEKLK